MTIKEAIALGKENGEWFVSPDPVSVLVIFWNKDIKDVDETELDLYANDKESELAALWESLVEEMSSLSNLVQEVCMCSLKE